MVCCPVACRDKLDPPSSRGEVRVTEGCPAPRRDLLPIGPPLAHPRCHVQHNTQDILPPREREAAWCGGDARERMRPRRNEAGRGQRASQDLPCVAWHDLLHCGPRLDAVCVTIISDSNDSSASRQIVYRSQITSKYTEYL